ncbi:MAG TPA: hypothetical protein VFE45_10885, partial [Coriobacteriia bacterium]|nr:hypothetical protein [Coriobacteriia bacterium]
MDGPPLGAARSWFKDARRRPTTGRMTLPDTLARVSQIQTLLDPRPVTPATTAARGQSFADLL